MKRKGKHDALRNNENVLRWYRNIEQGAKITADVYLRTLGHYCNIMKTSPEEIMEEVKSGKLRTEFMDFVADMTGKGKAGSYIVRFKKVIFSWTAFNGVDFWVVRG